MRYAALVSVVALGALVSTAHAQVPQAPRVPLSDAARAALVTRVQAVHAMGRCEPESFSPGDPRYSMDFPANHYAGHLPADPSAIAARTAGPCAAPARLAWWLAERFNAGSRGPR